ncbi:MAG: peptide deformylase [Candidatus Paceibacterota bacterium]|jgi:peptide deformylase
MLSEENKKIWTIFDKKEEKLLRKKMSNFNFSKYTKKETEELVKFMRKMMIINRGVGLAANQIGLNLNIFVAQLPERRNEKGGYVGKFYAVFNPRIISQSKTKIEEQEGCLSVPGFYGEVERTEKIEIEGYDKNQRKINVKANGLLARIFQHETDHLIGRLYIDRTKKVFKIEDKPNS